MARTSIYYDPQGMVCTKERTEEILLAAEGSDPYALAHYEGRTVRAVVRTIVALRGDPKIIPIEHWRPVTVTVSDVTRTTVEGEPLDPPVVTPDPPRLLSSFAMLPKRWRTTRRSLCNGQTASAPPMAALSSAATS